jgi:hypothetical protein
MHKSVKLITALSVAGLAVAAGSAFTGAGVTTDGQAAADQFIGGTVSQTVTGATLERIDYEFAAGGTNTAVNKVNLKFTADAKINSKTPALKLHAATEVDFECAPIAADGTTSCTPPEGVTDVPDVTKASVTVL